jgi:hypothetical protein
MRWRDEKRTPGVRRADALAALLALGLAVQGCVSTPPVPPPAPPPAAPAAAPSPAASSPREALLGFVAAARAGDFETAWRLLAGPLRARYSPETLARDFSAVQVAAQQRLARAELAAAGEPQFEGETASFPVGGDSFVRLIKEEGGWRVLALE